MCEVLCGSKTTRRISQIGFLVAALIILEGCATKAAFVAQSTKANISLEEAHNQILLLNVMRAAFRRPMYFSTVTEFNGPIGHGFASGSLGLSFQPYDAAPNLIPGIQFTPDRASFKVAPLDNQEFVTGFTTPVKLATFDYFLQQRWPPELLLALFVDHISVYNVNDGKLASEPLKSFENYPGNKDKYEAFAFLTQALAGPACQLRASAEDASEQLSGPSLPATNLLKLDQRVLVAKEGVALRKESKDGDEAYSLWLLKKSFRLLVKPACLESFASAQLAMPNKTGKLYEKMQPFFTQIGDSSTLVRSTTDTSKHKSVGASKSEGSSQYGSECKKKDCIVLNIGFRSPQSIVYYLGELARTQLFGTEACISGPTLENDRCEKYVPMIKMRGKEQELIPITVSAVPTSTDGELGVEYLGKYYSVRTLADRPDRSMQALSLVSLLIGLQKKASDLPTSSTVRLIGQP